MAFGIKSTTRIVVLFLTVIIFCFTVICWITTNPRVVLLRSSQGADWIRRNRSFNLHGQTSSATFSAFSTDFSVPSGVTIAKLNIWALRSVAVAVDGVMIANSGPRIENWKEDFVVPISTANLTSGKHQLQLLIANRDGPAMVKAVCGELGIKTDSGWQASLDRQQWSSAALASNPWEPDVCEQFETTQSDLKRLWPLLIGLFMAGSLLSLALDSELISASRIRWIVLAGWFVLAINNLQKLPTYVGYDSDAHYQYIQYVVHHHWIPLPSAGWQYFQTPMYYVVSAMVYKLLWLVGVRDAAMQGLLRVVPMTCGAAMAQLCYVVSGRVFPTRDDLRSAATLFGGLIPVNLYMGQSLSNEPMAAVAGGIVTLLTLSCIHLKNPPTRSQTVLIGTALAFAILSKVSAVIWIFPVLVVLLMQSRKQAPYRLSVNKSSIAFGMPILCIAGPYFLRNQLLAGQLGFFNTQPWWQDPGFRTPSTLLSFGHVFSHPAYSGLRSFWDSMYATIFADGMLSSVTTYSDRPPWNYGLMSCSLCLSIFPLCILFCGAIRALLPAKSTNAETVTSLRFCVLATLIFVLASLYIFLTLPIFSCAKGSYLLGTVPCLAILLAAGSEPLMRHKITRAVTFGLMFTWSIVSYATFFIR